MTTDHINLLGISGSLRAGSYNTALLHAVAGRLPDGVTLTIASLHEIPLYNPDVQKEGWPPPVAELRAQIAAADGILFASPEYNYSVTGVLKNAIDWASRQPDMPLRNKPMAIMGAATGNFGTIRAQNHLRNILLFASPFIVNQPQILVNHAREKFNAEGELTDETTRDFIDQMIAALLDMVARARYSPGE